MSNHKKIILFIAGFFLAACQTVNIPDAYKLSVRETMNNPYGCWMITDYKSDVNDSTSVSGELIYLNTDTIYLLARDSMVMKINSTSVFKAELCTHRNLAGTYAGISALFLVPNILGAVVHGSEYAGGFLLIGLQVIANGIASSLVEGIKHNNILEYPKKQMLVDFNSFARFPGGLPPDIDLTQLTLKKSNRNN